MLAFDAWSKQHFPANRMVTRALGVEDMVLLETHIHDIQSGDIYLILLGWLVRYVARSANCCVMSEHASLPEMGAALIATACEAGGRDNIAVVLVRAQGVAPPCSFWWPFKR